MRASGAPWRTANTPDLGRGSPVTLATGQSYYVTVDATSAATLLEIRKAFLLQLGGPGRAKRSRIGAPRTSGAHVHDQITASGAPVPVVILFGRSAV